MKTKSKIKFPTVPVVTFVAIILVISATLAVFFSQVDVGLIFQVSNFTASSTVTFDGVNPATPVARGYQVDVKDSTAANYIGKLRVNVSYAGNGVGLIRVRIVEEWSTTPDGNGVRQVLPYAIKMPYYIGNPNTDNGANNAKLYVVGTDSGNQKKWFDNRENDYCYYFATPVNCSSNSAETIPLITGFDTSKIDLGAIDASTQVYIQIESDVIQVNRYPQFWGVNILPWASPVSATQEDIATS